MCSLQGDKIGETNLADNAAICMQGCSLCASVAAGDYDALSMQGCNVTKSCCYFKNNKWKKSTICKYYHSAGRFWKVRYINPKNGELNFIGVLLHAWLYDLDFEVLIKSVKYLLFL